MPNWCVRLPRRLFFLVLLGGVSFAVCPGSRHQTTIGGFALSPDATRIAAIGDDGTLFWWDVASGKRTELKDCIQPQALDYLVVFSPDSMRVAVAAQNAILLLNVLSGDVSARLTSPRLKTVHSFIFSPDGRKLAVSTGDPGANKDDVVVWDIDSAEELLSIPGWINRHALAFTKSGAFLAVSGSDGIDVWNTRTKTMHRSIPLVNGAAEAIAFAGNDSWIVAEIATALPPRPGQHIIERKHDLRIWSMNDGKQLKLLAGLVEELHSPLAVVRGNRLLSVEYHYLRSWDLESGTLTASWDSEPGYPDADGKFFVRRADQPGRLELWEIGKPAGEVKAFIYRSPLCDRNEAAGATEQRFENLYIADGYSEEGAEFGTFNTLGYVAQDCTPVGYSRFTFKSPERAKQEFDKLLAGAKEVVENGRAHDLADDGTRGVRAVVRYAGKPPNAGGSVMWTEGSSFFIISSSSLDTALALERQFFQHSHQK